MTDYFFWGRSGLVQYPAPSPAETSIDGYTYRSFGTSMWFRPDGSPVSPSEHIEIDRRMNALMRKQMEPT